MVDQPFDLEACACKHAAADTEHKYTQVENFRPHWWVLEAMREAYRAGVASVKASP